MEERGDEVHLAGDRVVGATERVHKLLSEFRLNVCHSRDVPHNPQKRSGTTTNLLRVYPTARSFFSLGRKLPDNVDR